MDSFPSLNFVTNVLSPVIGILTAVPVFFLGYDRFFGRDRKHKKWMQKATRITWRLPAVLIVDLLAARDIGAAVRHFMAGDENLKNVPADCIIKINRDMDIIPDDMPALARDIQNAAGEVLRHGADELYVFLAGPGCAAAMVGAELSNLSCKVLLYQNDRATRTYVNFGPLRHPRF